MRQIESNANSADIAAKKTFCGDTEQTDKVYVSKLQSLPDRKRVLIVPSLVISSPALGTAPNSLKLLRQRLKMVIGGKDSETAAIEICLLMTKELRSSELNRLTIIDT